MIERWVAWSARQSLSARIGLFYSKIIALAVLFVLLGLTNAAATAFAMMAGLVVGGMFYQFLPFSYVWGRARRSLVYSTHVLAMMVILVFAARAFFEMHGALISDSLSFAQRIWGLGVSAIGVLIAAIVLGYGKFRPDPEVVMPESC